MHFKEFTITCQTTFKEGLLGISNTWFKLGVLHLDDQAQGGNLSVAEEDAPSSTQQMAASPRDE